MDWIKNERLGIFRLFVIFFYASVALSLLFSPVIIRFPTVLADPLGQPQADQAVSRSEHQEIQTEIDRLNQRFDTVENRQIDVLSRLSSLESKVDNLKAMADRREGMLDTMMVGLGILIVEVTIRGLTKLKDVVKRGSGT